MTAIFEQTPHPYDRRQIVRHLIQLAKVTDDVEQTIFLALQDNDWEVRVSAVIACARLQLFGLAQHLLKVDVKIPAKYLPNKIDRELVFGVWQVSKMILAQIQPERVDLTNKKHQRWQKLYDCVRTPFLTIDDAISHLVYYFTNPNDITPIDSTDGLVFNKEDQTYYLPNTSIEMIWVAPGEYYLGESSAEQSSLQAVSNGGFYISRLPLLDEQDEPQYLNEGECVDQLVHLQSKTSLNNLTIPTPVQWKMAASGIDGRRHPWGWGVEEDWAVSSSATGMLLFWIDEGEWTELDKHWFMVNQWGKTLNFQQVITDSSAVRKPCRVVYS